MNLESKAIRARPDTPSLRSTIPSGIVAFLDLQDGDILEWIMDTQNDERQILLKKKS